MPTFSAEKRCCRGVAVILLQLANGNAAAAATEPCEEPAVGLACGQLNLGRRIAHAMSGMSNTGRNSTAPVSAAGHDAASSNASSMVSTSKIM